jgi:serralysin
MLDGGRGDDVLNGGDGADAFIVGPDKPFPSAVVQLTRTPSDASEIETWFGMMSRKARWSNAPGPASKPPETFMWNADGGTRGSFIGVPTITSEGSQLIFQEAETASVSPGHDYMLI